MGLSFAIPITVAKNVVQQLKTKGKVSRGWLGILIQDVNRELAESFGMEQPIGAVVLKVIDDSPAAKANFKIGDVVVEFDGKKINRSSDLPIAVGSTEIGKKVNVRVIREGKTVSLSVKIGELPSEEELAENGKQEKSAKLNQLGVAVGNLTAEQRRRLEIKKGGVIVQDIDKGPANDANIKRGDVILKINNHDVKDTDHFEQLIKKLKKGQSVPVLIQRGNNPIFLAIKIPKD